MSRKFIVPFTFQKNLDEAEMKKSAGPMKVVNTDDSKSILYFSSQEQVQLCVPVLDSQQEVFIQITFDSFSDMRTHFRDEKFISVETLMPYL